MYYQCQFKTIADHGRSTISVTVLFLIAFVFCQLSSAAGGIHSGRDFCALLKGGIHSGGNWLKGGIHSGGNPFSAEFERTGCDQNCIYSLCNRGQDDIQTSFEWPFPVETQLRTVLSRFSDVDSDLPELLYSKALEIYSRSDKGIYSKLTPTQQTFKLIFEAMPTIFEGVPKVSANSAALRKLIDCVFSSGSGCFNSPSHWSPFSYVNRLLKLNPKLASAGPRYFCESNNYQFVIETAFSEVNNSLRKLEAVSTYFYKIFDRLFPKSVYLEDNKIHLLSDPGLIYSLNSDQELRVIFEPTNSTAKIIHASRDEESISCRAFLDF